MRHKKLSVVRIAQWTPMTSELIEIVRKLNHIYSLKPKSRAKRLYQLYFYGRFLTRKEERDPAYNANMAIIAKSIKEAYARYDIILSETESLIATFDPDSMYFESSIVFNSFCILRNITINDGIIKGDVSKIRSLLTRVYIELNHQQIFLSAKHLMIDNEEVTNNE